MNKKTILALMLSFTLLSGCVDTPQTTDTWNDSQISIFDDHLYSYDLPYESGYTVSYDDENDCVVVKSDTITLDDFSNYVNLLVGEGFKKTDGPFDNSFILSKDILVDGVKKFIEIDIYYANGQLNAVCYDPYVYEWQAGFLDYIFSELYFKAPEATIPMMPADRYLYDTTFLFDEGILFILCETETNYESQYQTALIQAGFIIDETTHSGYFVATDPEMIIDVKYSFVENEGMYFVLQPHDGWPTGAIAYYTNQFPNCQSTVPAVVGADSYEFIDSAWDSHGYFFVLCETGTNFESTYKETLESANYTVYDDSVNLAGNYFAISDNEDLLIQYKYVVVESIMGGDDYKHFDVMFEPYYPHDDTYIAEKLDLIQPGTETVIPTYPGYGEEVSLSDNNINLFITIQSSTYEAFNSYLQTLDNAGWSVKPEIETYLQYQAISPNRDIILKTSLKDGRIELAISAYEDEYSEWPIDGVNKILSTLGLTGTIPEFEGAFGYDYENGDHGFYDVICAVRPKHEQEAIDAYITKLEENDWFTIEDGDVEVYVHDGYTIALYPYFEYAGQGYVYIDIAYGDGTIFDLDARDAFNKWKNDNEISSDVLYPGINLTSDIIETELSGDKGVSYEGYNLFRLTVDLGEGDLDEAIGEVIDTFINDGWTLSDSSYHKDSLFMKCYKQDGKLVIDMCAPIPQKTIISIMKEFLHDLGGDYEREVTLPDSIELPCDYTIEIDSYYDDYFYPDLSMYVVLTESKADESIAAIVGIFENANWEQIDSGKNYVTLTDFYELLELRIQKDDSKTLLIQFSGTY